MDLHGRGCKRPRGDLGSSSSIMRKRVLDAMMLVVPRNRCAVVGAAHEPFLRLRWPKRELSVLWWLWNNWRQARVGAGRHSPSGYHRELSHRRYQSGAPAMAFLVAN